MSRANQNTSDTFGNKSRYISPIELKEVVEKMEKQKYELQVEFSKLYDAIVAKKTSTGKSKVSQAKKISTSLINTNLKYDTEFGRKSEILKSTFKSRKVPVQVNFHTTKEFDDHCNDIHCTKINTLLEQIKVLKASIKDLRKLE